MGTVTGYNSAFQYILLKCADVSTSKVLNRYFEGLKSEPRAWVQMHVAGGFGLSSSPRLRGRGAGWDVILPIV